MTAARHGTLSGSNLRVVSGSASHVGRVREHNEDHLIADGTVFAVADGMGGHAAGEVASHLVIEALATLRERPPERADDVGAALAAANQRILQSQADNPEQRGMGTTVSGLSVVTAGGGQHWVVFNIGDSRVYRLADNAMSLVTRDHSEVRELLDAGLIEQEEVARHPLRNVITRSLGSDPAPDADVWVLPPSRGERFVVCSDGLSNELDDREIMLIARTYADPQIAADQLVGAAVRAGGRDNVSVVVVAVESEEGVDDDADTARRADPLRAPGAGRPGA
ncbi:MAG: protein phosphatase 2C domain-containing protein [Ornithinibacter sp.]